MVRSSEPTDESNGTLPKEKDGATGSDGPSGRSNDHVERRSFLKWTGAAAAASALGVGSANAAEYETITLNPGESRQVRLGDGDTFENVLIDQSAEGAVFSIKASGDGWTIRNVGFKGAGARDRFSFYIRAQGNGVIENVYANNKQPPNDPMGMIWTGRGHWGHIKIRHTYIEGMGNNAAYCSGQHKKDGAGGTVEHEKCYHIDNTPTNYRPAGEGSVIRDCVSVVDDPSHERAYYPNGSADKSRPTWPSHTPGIRMENVHFYTNPNDVNPGAYFCVRHESFSDTSSCEVTAVDCAGNLPQDHSLFESHKGNTDLTVQNYRQGEQTVEVLGEGVPLSAEMAARGERALPSEMPRSDESTDSGPDLGRTLTIDGAYAGWTDYEFTVSGDLENDPNTGSFNPDDVIDGSTVTGFVNGGVDGYRFSGDITDAFVDGDAMVLVDGEQADFSDGGSGLDRTLVVDTEEGVSGVEYEIVTSGEIRAGQEAESSDTISENNDGTWTVEGIVGNGFSDSFEFTGDVVDVSLTDQATVSVDGEPLDLGGAAPTIEQYQVQEAGSPNPDANILAYWEVADADGDLASVTVDVSDENGTVVKSATTSVSGDVAYDVNYFEITDVDGQAFDVQLTVTDAAGNQVSDAEPVQE